MDAMMAAGAVGIILLAAFAVLAVKLFSAGGVRDVDPEWLRNFTIEQYRPMERLLSESDFEFLRNQPGYTRDLERNLRRERRMIFRSYLRLLGRDFERFHLALRLLARDAAEDRPELAVELVRQKAIFIAGMWLVQMKLSLHALGVGSVDVRALVSQLDAAQWQMRELLVTAGTA